MKTPTKFKDEKMASLLTKFAAEYFAVESNKNSLMTVTRAEMLDKGRRALIYFTALPERLEPEALEFANRRKNDFRKFIMQKRSFGFAPKIEFSIDFGEHNRQRIDELSNQG